MAPCNEMHTHGNQVLDKPSHAVNKEVILSIYIGYTQKDMFLGTARSAVAAYSAY